MAMTYDLLKSKLKSEGKFTLQELLWMVDKMEAMDKAIESAKTDLGERISRIERKDDDHIPGGL